MRIFEVKDRTETLIGFKVYKRAELDEQGNPYPILYMRLEEYYKIG